MTLETQKDLPTPTKLIRSSDLLGGLAAQRSLSLEQSHGNGDLIKLLDILGIAGPFKVKSPWELEDAEGRHLIHAGGYASMPFGERYPPLIGFVQAFLEQSRSMAFPQQSASDWRAALEYNLIALLAQDAPSHSDSQVFFSNSGAEAVEAALKFAKAARPEAPNIINFSRAYHGKTFGALSLTPNEEYQALFRPLIPNIHTLPYGDLPALEQSLYTLGPKTICAIILEPIQGEGGVITPPSGFLPGVQVLAQKYGITVIADEVQSGLGRTGYWFASLAGGLEPDIITLAKPLGGGLVPVGATIARKWIVGKMLGGLESKRHSNTFGGGSLAMAVGLKSLELIQDEGLLPKVRTDGHRGLERLKAIQERFPGYIREVRGAGMLFALQLRHVIKPALLGGQQELAAQFGTALALRTMHQHGLHVCFTLNSSQVIRLTPALNMPPDIFNEMMNRVEKAATAHKNAWLMLPKTPLIRLLKLAGMALK